MKVEVNEKAKHEEPEYPCLKISDNMIVIFTGPKKGVVLSGNEGYPLGYEDDDWIEDIFKPFHGTITLSNE